MSNNTSPHELTTHTLANKLRVPSSPAPTISQSRASTLVSLALADDDGGRGGGPCLVGFLPESPDGATVDLPSYFFLFVCLILLLPPPPLCGGDWRDDLRASQLDPTGVPLLVGGDRWVIIC